MENKEAEAEFSYRLRSSFTTPFPPNPSCSAICCCVYPSFTNAFTVGSNSCTFSYFLGMTTPPVVVLLFSYIRGCFVYCPFLLVRFNGLRGAGFCYLFLFAFSL